MKSKTYLTIAQTAQRTGFTPKAIRMKVARRMWPFVRVGRRILIPEAELETFLSSLPGSVTGEEAAERVAAVVAVAAEHAHSK